MMEILEGNSPRFSTSNINNNLAKSNERSKKSRSEQDTDDDYKKHEQYKRNAAEQKKSVEKRGERVLNRFSTKE